MSALIKKVLIDGVEKKIISEVIDKKLWFKVNDQIFSYDLIDLQQGSGAAQKKSSKSPDKIMAPMPGKISKIFVSDGQKVNKGDSLIVMEAMKMEYTLKSDLDTVVEKILVQVQQQVVLGQMLVQLQKVEIK